MIIRLVNENKKTICETEVYINKDESLPTLSGSYSKYLEILSSVNIIHYSSKLLSLDKKSQRRFIEDIDFLSELRGWYYEHYRTTLKKKFRKEHPNDDIKTVHLDISYELKECSNSIKEFYNEIGAKYGLLVYID